MARDYIKIVRDLLAKAQSTAFTDEAEALTAKATELMFTHQIDEAALGEGNGSDDALGKIEIRLTGYARPKASLVTVVAKAFDSVAILTDRRGGGQVIMTVFGWASNLATVEVLYASLEMQAEAQSIRSANRNRWENARSHKAAFLHGFAHEVDKRLQAQRKVVREEQASSSTALVLLDRATLAKQHAEQAIGGRTRTLGGRVGSSSGFGAGRDAGARADLGGGSLGGQRKALAR